MQLLKLNRVSQEAVGDVSGSFDRLPHTNHKDGEYRLRRYSVVELRTSFWNATREVEVERLSHRDFVQGEDLNKHQGGMVRSFEEIEDDVLQSEGMKEMLLLFKQENKLDDGQEVEIHQMRVKCLEDKYWTPVSPEGIHQDGFDHISMVGINRCNIHGGKLMVHKSKGDPHPVVDYALEDGEMIMLNDRELWHNATPITKEDESSAGYGDWFIFCAKI